jgi:hypothetical protein
MKEDKKNESPKKVREVLVSGIQTLPPLEGLEMNLNIPTHHVNIANIMASNDGLVLISFFSRIPGHNIETCRISMPQQTVKKMVDIICQQLSYSPQIPSRTPEKTKK